LREITLVKILVLSPSLEAAVRAFPTLPPPFTWKKKKHVHGQTQEQQDEPAFFLWREKEKDSSISALHLQFSRPHLLIRSGE
jgi:hypothetical protein